jgi:hypothetical protein
LSTARVGLSSTASARFGEIRPPDLRVAYRARLPLGLANRVAILTMKNSVVISSHAVPTIGTALRTNGFGCRRPSRIAAYDGDLGDCSSSNECALCSARNGPAYVQIN